MSIASSDRVMVKLPVTQVRSAVSNRITREVGCKSPARKPPIIISQEGNRTGVRTSPKPSTTIKATIKPITSNQVDNSSFNPSTVETGGKMVSTLDPPRGEAMETIGIRGTCSSRTGSRESMDTK